MMSGREALRLYKTLHRTIQRVFVGDSRAMLAARDKVCQEFAKYRAVTSESSVTELVNQGWEAQKTLSQLVVQMEKVERDTYKINIRDENYKFENNPFRNDISDEEYKAANRKSRRKKKACDEK